MSRRDDDRFRLRPGAPAKSRQRYIARVLKAVSRAGGRSLRGSGKRPGARLGRGHVAAKFSDSRLPPGARRVAIKTRLVNLKQAGARSTLTHLRYIEREGVGRDNKPGQAYGPATDNADLAAFEERGRGDRHQFRLIVSPEDAEQLDDLRTFTRHLMDRMEGDLGTSLDWVAVDHWNTDNPHTHVVLRGRDDAGRDLVISRDYIASGMRERAGELATEWLGPRTEREVQQSLQNEVEQERWTSLDRNLKYQSRNGEIRLDSLSPTSPWQPQRRLLVGRLQYLQRLGLARENTAGNWSLDSSAERTLRSMGERGDIIRSMQRAMGGEQRELVMPGSHSVAGTLTGRIAGRGFADDFHDRGYLVVDGLDGRAHYLTLPANALPEHYPVGGIVEVQDRDEVRAIDRCIAVQAYEGANEGLYHAGEHLADLQQAGAADPDTTVQAHVRRLEALRRAGIVERLSDGVWQIPDNLPERARQYDRQHYGDQRITLLSHLPLEQQVGAHGATWLDRQLLSRQPATGPGGFGAGVESALGERRDFLVEQGLATRQGGRFIPARHLLLTLRERELTTVAQDIAGETGLAYRPLQDGQRTSGIYRRNLQLVSGRFAMLDDSTGFSLVPWKPVLEQRLGQSLSATVSGNSASWEIGRTRGPSVA